MVKEKTVIARNIKTLRELNDETQSELSKVIFRAESAVAMYESGLRIPTIQTLKMIASHYNCSVDDLRHIDFSKVIKQQTDVAIDKLISRFDILFPIVSSKNAFADPNFAKGYRYSTEIMNSFKELQAEPPTKLFDEFLSICDAYKESIEVNKTLESAANLLSLYFLIFYMFYPDKSMMGLGFTSLSNNVEFKNLMGETTAKDICKIFDDFPVEKKQFIASFEDEIVCYIKLLKNSLEYAPLADYYLALRYFIGFIDSKYTQRTNVKIAVEVMSSLHKIDNPYATSFINDFLGQ